MLTPTSLVLVALLACAAWISNLCFDGERLRPWPAYAFSGDEPHYVLAINSLLADRDLDLHEDYYRVRQGGTDAGVRLRGQSLDHHTHILDPATGRRASWPDVYDRTVRIPCPPNTLPCVGFAPLGPQAQVFSLAQNVREVGSHPFAFPAVLAVMIAPWWWRPADTEPLASSALVVLMLAGILVTYLVARRAGLARPFAIGAAAALGLASPWLPYAKTFFSDLVMGLPLLVALWAMIAKRPRAAAVVMIAAIWMKSLFVVVVVGWTATLWLRGERRAALWHAGIAAAGTVAMMAVNYLLIRTPVLSGHLGWEWVHVWWHPALTLIDPKNGLLWFVPWSVLSLVAIAVTLLQMAVRRQPEESLEGTHVVRLTALPILLILVVLGLFNSLGGDCLGPRYWVPMLPWLALIAAECVAYSRWVIRIVASILVVAGFLFAVSSTLLRDTAWNRPPWQPLGEVYRGMMHSP